MVKNNRKREALKKLLVATLVFGPASLMVLFTMGKCNNRFVELPKFGQMPQYEFTGANGKVVNNETQKGKLTIFMTLQTSCPEDCAIDLFRFNLLVYQFYRKNHKQLKYVNLVSIVTDKDGNPVDNLNEILFTLNDMVQGYDSTIWNVVTGDPKQIYNIENNGVNLYEAKSDSAFAGKLYLEIMLLVDQHNELRFVRRGNSEGLIRDFEQHVSLLQKQYQDEKNKQSEAKEK